MRGPFSLGVAADPFWSGKRVGPLFVDQTLEEIAADGYRVLRRPPVPPGYTGTYPFIVKVNTSGEFIVYADGTAQYMDYGRGEISDPINIKPGF
jgi:hypothetical protein